MLAAGGKRQRRRERVFERRCKRSHRLLRFLNTNDILNRATWPEIGDDIIEIPDSIRRLFSARAGNVLLKVTQAFETGPFFIEYFERFTSSHNLSSIRGHSSNFSDSLHGDYIEIEISTRDLRIRGGG